MTGKKKYLLYGLLALAFAAHVVYWYWPRERSAVLDPESVTGKALRSGGYDLCAWLPYPHQNLGAFAGSLPDGKRFFAAAARLAGARAPKIPSFGPFAIPPAREIAACADLQGQRLYLAARIYPFFGAVARLAGKVAGNPWLSGGEVRQSVGAPGEFRERVFQVAWTDGYWTVRSGAVRDIAPDPEAPAPRYPEALGLARISRPVAPLPAGAFVLHRVSAGLELALIGGAEPPVPPIDYLRDDPVFLAIGGPDWPDGAERPLPPAAFVLYDLDGGLRLGPLGVMPGAALLHPPDRPRWSLPTGGLGKLLTDNLPKGEAQGWHILAFDERSLDRAEAFAPALARFTPPDGSEAAGGLTLGLWLRPRLALKLVRQVRHGLEKVPLVNDEEIEPWIDGEVLLDAFERSPHLSLVSTQAPDGFRLLVETSGGSPAATQGDH